MFHSPSILNKPGEAFPKQLEALLRTNFPGREIEVLNAGIHGYTSYQGLAQLKYRLVRYQPDLVIVQFGINDLSDAVGYPDKDQHPPISLKIAIAQYVGGKCSGLYIGTPYYLQPALWLTKDPEYRTCA